MPDNRSPSRSSPQAHRALALPTPSAEAAMPRNLDRNARDRNVHHLLLAWRAELTAHAAAGAKSPARPGHRP